ncbi:hypothetical protein [Streptomyces sp. Ag109_O5-1]|uniref:hypothetical protein n=1 Tax=Streptomyces sp. Ag109_O5-1 TaxID=1938851 RepID=UPI0016259C12|nr:hypothetical protein [Streptomyces sp. Ag109_O5-1]
MVLPDTVEQILVVGGQAAVRDRGGTARQGELLLGTRVLDGGARSDPRRQGGR